MIERLLRHDVQEFIHLNELSDIAGLVLKYKADAQFPLIEAIDQIRSKRKSKLKLPTWYNKEGIVFPSPVSIEQSSSEVTAEYKASIVSGNLLADITGGAGVDSYYFSKQFSKVDYVEQNEVLANITRHNHTILERQNIVHHSCTAQQFLKKTNELYDCIYIDPARRSSKDEKVFKLEDCEPNILKMQADLFSKANTILLKTSPLLDIDLVIKSLKSVCEIHVVSVNNECKEVLYLLKKDFKENHDLLINTINVSKNGTQVFCFSRVQEGELEPHLGQPLNFLYEPNAAIMKSGAFKTMAFRYGLHKLHVHSHLYTSEKRVENFPGRTFKIIEVAPVDAKALSKIIPSRKANLAIRNFPLSISDLKKKLKIHDGGDYFVFATTLLKDKKALIICDKKV